MPLINPNTVFINTSTGQYPVSLTEFRRANPSYIFGDNVPDQILNAIGYAVVELTDVPTGDVVSEATPVLVDGQYKQAWDIRSFNEQEVAERLVNAKISRKARVTAALAETLAKGVEYDFGGDNGVLHIQIRDTDRTNLNGIRSIAEFNPSKVQYFRTQENKTVALSSEQAIAMTEAAYTGYVNVMQSVWFLNDQIDASKTYDELPFVPSTL